MRRRTRSGSPAAAVVEAALVAPLLLVIVVGIVEMALLMRDTVATSGVARTAARAAASQATADRPACGHCGEASVPPAARAAVEAVAEADTSLSKDRIEWVLVYQANSEGYPLPESNDDRLACTTNCVRYVWDEQADVFRYADGSWDAAAADVCADGRMALGVAIEARHSWMTGIFGETVTVDEHGVARPADGGCRPGTRL